VRKLLATPFASAVIGGGITAGVLLGAGAIDNDTTRTVFQQSPLSAPVQSHLRGGSDAPALTARDIYKRDAPGVAYIRARTLSGGPTPFDPYASTEDTESTGSGFVLDEDGHVLTNAHVVDGATMVTVTLSGTETRSAKIVGKDDSTDLAVLQINPDGIDLHPLELGSSTNLAVGDPTVAIGNPFGFDRTLTTGVISALQRRITAPDSYTIEDVIQTDAAINPGNSGGPLIDASGRVIGINSQIATGGNGGTGSVGIGFAVPVDTAKKIVNELMDHGQVLRPWMGITVAPIDSTLDSLDIPEDRGLLLQHTVPGSPAARAGLLGGDKSVILNTGQEMFLGGDVITRIGKTETETNADLQAALEPYEPGDTVPVAVTRDGTQLEFKVQLGNRPAGKADS
jgi:S1-C subfamily serine protease